MGPLFTVLTLAAAVPALLVWALSSFEPGILVMGAGVAILGWIRARHPQRETQEGLAAVRVAYPRVWPPGWGLEPLIALVAGIGAAFAGAIVLYWFGPLLFDAAGGGPVAAVAAATFVVPCVAVLVGISLAVMAYADH